MQASSRPRPVVLLILDGFGAREGHSPDDAIAQARMPAWRALLRDFPHSTIDASEHHVGLPDGQMGNSEVGHLNIGAGRVVHQDFTRIDNDIRSSAFSSNAVLVDTLDVAKRSGATVHVLGLVSPGGVHSHEDQIAALVALAAQRNAPRVAVHAFLDGRDTPPRSAGASLDALDAACAKARSSGTSANIVSVCGRYYAMDRDKRWERVSDAYALIVDGAAAYTAPSARKALEDAYARGESDEFVKATAIVDARGEPTRMRDGDVVIFMNFRADRARQLTRALTDAKFDGFPRARVPKLARYATLTSYGDEFAHLPIAYPPQSVVNGFGEYIAARGLRQLRIAETEKYAHVTYFFNGGTESVYTGEDRILVPSPKVATYDLQPQMSALEVTDRLVAAIQSGRYDAIICNYANADMVGHTGNFPAVVAAVETLDACVDRVVKATRAAGGEVLITADHGNAEMTHDAQTGQAHTAHTLNVVPFVYVGRPARVRGGGALKDVAPTMLAMMGLPKPAEMTGESLLNFEK